MVQRPIPWNAAMIAGFQNWPEMIYWQDIAQSFQSRSWEDIRLFESGEENFMVHHVERHWEIEEGHGGPRIDGDGSRWIFWEEPFLCWGSVGVLIAFSADANLSLQGEPTSEHDLLLDFGQVWEIRQRTVVLQVLTIQSNLLQNMSNYCPFECIRGHSFRQRFVK